MGGRGGVRTTSCLATHVVADDGQLLHYEEAPMYPARKAVRLPREVLDCAKDLRVRSDLESVGVAICSIEVRPTLPLLSLAVRPSKR